MTGCALCHVTGISKWHDVKSWHPRDAVRLFGSSLPNRINNFLKGLEAECGMGPERACIHSARAGCAPTLYANGVDTPGIQRWRRWKSPVYMRYVWHGNVKLHTLGHSLTRRTNLTDRVLAPEQNRGEVTFQDSYRCGWGNRTPIEANRPQEEGRHTLIDVASSFDREMMEITDDHRLKEAEKVRKYDKVETETKRILKRK